MPFDTRRPHLLKLLAQLTLILVVCLSYERVSGARPGVAEVEEALRDLRFEDARSQANEAIEGGGHEHDELAKLYLFSGQIAASLGEDSRARDAFAKALSISPDIRLPSGVSPKLAEPFDIARKGVDGAIELSTRVRNGQLDIKVSSDPADLVAAVEAEVKQGRKTRRIRERRDDSIQIILPKRFDSLTLRAIDSHGNYLTEAREFAPEATGDDDEADGRQNGDENASDSGNEEAGGSEDEGAGVVVERGPRASKQGLFGRWQLYGALTLASAGSGAFFGFSAQSLAEDIEKLEDGTEFSVAKDLETKAQKRALYSNISFGVAGAMALVTIWVATRDHGSGEDQRRAKVDWVPVLGPDKAGVAAFIEF